MAHTSTSSTTPTTTAASIGPDAPIEVLRSESSKRPVDDYDRYNI